LKVTRKTPQEALIFNHAKETLEEDRPREEEEEKEKEKEKEEREETHKKEEEDSQRRRRHTNESMQSKIQKKNKWFSTWNG
jgi:hypothetical protein